MPRVIISREVLHSAFAAEHALLVFCTGIRKVHDALASCRRQWLRAIWKSTSDEAGMIAKTAKDLSPHAQLLAFFASFPGPITLIFDNRHIHTPVHIADVSTAVSTPCTFYEGLRRQLGAILSLYYSPHAAVQLRHGDAPKTNPTHRYAIPGLCPGTDWAWCELV